MEKSKEHEFRGRLRYIALRSLAADLLNDEIISLSEYFRLIAIFSQHHIVQTSTQTGGH